MNFYTIGVYNTTESEFFQQLIDLKIDLFCDIRMRRGVRGATYAFVNSNQLQQHLKELNIAYRYLHELAPTDAIRNIQLENDKQHRVRQTERSSLCNEYIKAYQTDILEKFDFESFVKGLKETNVQNVMFFCVEENPHGCHRSLVLERLNGMG